MAQSPEPVHGRARRMSVGGKLSFRRRVPEVSGDDLPLVHGGDDPPRLDELVPEGFARVEVEIGPGKGAFLAAATAARPDTFFVGIEASPGYAAFAAAKLREFGVDNGVLLVDNASQFLRDCAPDANVARLHAYFPDPWPKRRHRGRRFFDESAATVVSRVLEPGGLLLVCTDNAAYAGQICRVLGASPSLRRDERAEAELPDLGPGHAFSPTHFEKKYQVEGRIIRRYVFERLERS